MRSKGSGLLSIIRSAPHSRALRSCPVVLVSPAVSGIVLVVELTVDSGFVIAVAVVVGGAGAAFAADENAVGAACEDWEFSQNETKLPTIISTVTISMSITMSISSIIMRRSVMRSITIIRRCAITMIIKMAIPMTGGGRSQNRRENNELHFLCRQILERK